MSEDEKMDFWNALGRLYDSTLKLQIACESLRETAVANEKRIATRK